MGPSGTPGGYYSGLAMVPPRRLAPPPLDQLDGDVMLAVASVPGKVPEEWRPVTPYTWMAWPHAADAWVHAMEMTAAQLRDLLAARDSHG